jgi:hypothetical protein
LKDAKNVFEALNITYVKLDEADRVGLTARRLLEALSDSEIRSYIQWFVVVSTCMAALTCEKQSLTLTQTFMANIVRALEFHQDDFKSLVVLRNSQPKRGGVGCPLAQDIADALQRTPALFYSFGYTVALSFRS